MRRWLKHQLASASVAIIWLGQATTAMAQETEAAEAGKTWVLGYALTVLVVIMGVAAVCRGGHRAEKPKMVEQELEHKLKKLSTQPK